MSQQIIIIGGAILAFFIIIFILNAFNKKVLDPAYDVVDSHFNSFFNQLFWLIVVVGGIALFILIDSGTI